MFCKIIVLVSVDLSLVSSKAPRLNVRIDFSRERVGKGQAELNRPERRGYKMGNRLSVPLVRHHLPFVEDLAPGQHPVDDADPLACRQDQRPLMRVVRGFVVLLLEKGFELRVPHPDLSAASIK
jgi:hypothetical protein